MQLAIMSCTHQQLEISKKSYINLVTYYSNDILNYAAFSLSINAKYSLINSYNFYIFEEKDSNYEPRDPRWNRVKILLNLIQESIYLKETVYYVWTDADLIFLDSDLKLEAIINSNLNYDIILSGERHAATGIANTGCMIIKTSEWSKYFFKLLWSSFDRTTAHDQFYFDKLYKSLLPISAEHIKILEPYILNSYPPPIIFQQPHHKILHLMGENNQIRSAIFSQAFKNMCISNYKLHQLGVDRSTILKTTYSKFANSFSFFLNQIEIPLTLNLRYLTELREIIILSVKYFNDSDLLHIKKDNNEFKTNLNNSKFYDIISNQDNLLYIKEKSYICCKIILVDISTKTNYSKIDYINALNICSVLGHDLIQQHNNLTRKLEVLGEVIESLNILLNIVDANSKVHVSEMISGAFYTFAEIYNAKGEINEAILYLQKSLQILEINIDFNKFHIISPLKLLSNILCGNNNYFLGLETFDNLIKILRDILKDEKTVKEDHLLLATSLIERASCIIASENNKLSFSSEKDLLDAYSILNIHQEVSTTTQIYKLFENVLSKVADASKIIDFYIKIQNTKKISKRRKPVKKG